MTILDALDDPNLFGPLFQPATWAAWRVVLAAVFGLPMTPEQLAKFQRHTRREHAPTEPAREAWLIVGRRGGKSRLAALLVTFLACFRQYQLAPGERGVAMVIAADRRQARVMFRYICGLVDACPMLARMVAQRTSESLRLTNGIDVEIHTASFRSTRGYTVVAAVLDESAYFPTDESANPDTEIAAAIRPGMASVAGALLVGISSPHARRGLLWEQYAAHYGKDGDSVLVWQADTASMNPTIDPAVISAAYEEDELRAAAEYGAQFRRDVEGYVTRETIAACVVAERHELPPVSGVSYVAFVDPSGGSQDSMTLAIAHRDGDRVMIDAVRERRPPFSPDAVVAEYTALLERYRVTTVRGDRYAGEWPRERFHVHGVHYAAASKPKSELYSTLLPLLNAGRVELPDDRRLAAQLLGLERRTARGGRESIDHAPNAHDDLANAVAGAAVEAATRSGFPEDPRLLVRRVGGRQPMSALERFLNN